MTPRKDSDPVGLRGTCDPPGVGSWSALGIGLHARGLGQGRIEMRLDYCPARRAMGQVGLDRVVQVREPSMKADPPLTGEAVAVVAQVVEEQARSRRVS